MPFTTPPPSRNIILHVTVLLEHETGWVLMPVKICWYVSDWYQSGSHINLSNGWWENSHLMFFGVKFDPRVAFWAHLCKLHGGLLCTALSVCLSRPQGCLFPISVNTPVWKCQCQVAFLGFAHDQKCMLIFWIHHLLERHLYSKDYHFFLQYSYFGVISDPKCVLAASPDTPLH